MNPSVSKFLSSVEKYKYQRWVLFFGLEAVLIIRMILYRGFYVVGYIEGLTLLNLFFESIYSNTSTNGEGEGIDEDVNEVPLHTIKDIEAPPSPILDQSNNETELSGDVRLWYAFMITVIISLIAVMIPALDIPVFWPLLLIYFLAIFILTMREPLWIMLTKRYTPMNHQ